MNLFYKYGLFEIDTMLPFNNLSFLSHLPLLFSNTLLSILHLHFGRNLHRASLPLIARHAIPSSRGASASSIHTCSLTAHYNVSKSKLESSPLRNDAGRFTFFPLLAALLARCGCDFFGLQALDKCFVAQLRFTGKPDTVMFDGDEVRVGNAHVGRLEDLLLSGTFANAFDIFRVLSYASDGG
jgi:hypothetical protein